MRGQLRPGCARFDASRSRLALAPCVRATVYARAVTWVVRMAIAAAINVLALIVADWAFDGLSIERWGPIILAGIVLGLANVFLKPLVTFIALPLILLTFGIAYFFVNVVMLLFTEWVTPDFSIDGFWTYVGATIVIWLVNWLGSLAIVAALDDD